MYNTVSLKSSYSYPIYLSTALLSLHLVFEVDVTLSFFVRSTTSKRSSWFYFQVRRYWTRRIRERVVSSCHYHNWSTHKRAKCYWLDSGQCQNWQPHFCRSLWTYEYKHVQSDTIATKKRSCLFGCTRRSCKKLNSHQQHEKLAIFLLFRTGLSIHRNIFPWFCQLHLPKK